jgi:hypothetical protein
VPPWEDTDLDHKLRDAEEEDSRGRGYLLDWCRDGGTKKARAPKLLIPEDPVPYIKRLIGDFRCDLASLHAASAVPLPGDPTEQAILLLETLYTPQDKINYVTKYIVEKSGKVRLSGTGTTRTRDDLISSIRHHGVPKGNAGVWLRMNPVDGKGVEDANVTAFRFALVELDHVPLDLQISLVAKLQLPIAAILTSGGRSVHVWVRIEAKTADEYRATVDKMLRLLARFGVDQQNKNPSRASRFPGAQRVLGAVGEGRQQLAYLNSMPEGKRIL